MKIIKFGGTSVGSVENVKKIDEIIRNQQSDLIVVVSAVGGVTDLLLSAANAGAKGNDVSCFEEYMGEARKYTDRAFRQDDPQRGGREDEKPLR